MIGLLEGVVREKDSSSMILMVHGVGYLLEYSSGLDSYAIGDEVVTYIYTHVREDAIRLFGFASQEERSLFELLLGVSGVGPKGAMNIISHISVSKIVQAIRNREEKVFTSVSGVGKKNAERIIIELESKISQYAISVESSEESYAYADLESALRELGYSQQEVKEVERSIHSANLPEMIKEALQLLSPLTV